MDFWLLIASRLTTNSMRLLPVRRYPCLPGRSEWG